jgi:hypothetical protein
MMILRRLDLAGLRSPLGDVDDQADSTSCGFDKRGVGRIGRTTHRTLTVRAAQGPERTLEAV